MAGVNRDCNQECIWNAPGTGCIKPDSMVCEIEERGKRMKTEIIKIKGDWQEVVDDCRATVKKSPLGKEPSKEFKKAILISEHDPIRDIILKFTWRDIKYWVAMHWKTHIWRSRTNTQRNDRQSDYDRDEAPQRTLIDLVGDPNVQHLIDTWRKRLCFMASPETRELAEDLKIVLHGVEPEISDVLVPNCVYRCGCPEMGGGCGWYSNMVARYPDLASTDIQKRYDAYNEIFYGARRGEDGN